MHENNVLCINFVFSSLGLSVLLFLFLIFFRGNFFSVPSA